MSVLGDGLQDDPLAPAEGEGSRVGGSLESAVPYGTVEYGQRVAVTRPGLLGVLEDSLHRALLSRRSGYPGARAGHHGPLTPSRPCLEPTWPCCATGAPSADPRAAVATTRTTYQRQRGTAATPAAPSRTPRPSVWLSTARVSHGQARRAQARDGYTSQRNQCPPLLLLDGGGDV
jgi:hypothetical protein